MNVLGRPTRVVVIHCPDWPVLAAGAIAGLPPGSAAAVVHANRVVAASPAARSEGVGTGQRRREAQRCCPHLILLDHDPARDARAFEPILHGLDVVTALVEITEPGTCLFATRGPSRYHGGDRQLAGRLTELVTELLDGQHAVGLVGSPGVGIADGRLAAELAAGRSIDGGGSPVVVGAGESPGFLAPFPVSVLDAFGEFGDSFTALLGRLGIHTLGALATLPRPDVLGRFGPEGERAHRLACGFDDRPPSARQPPDDLALECSFEPAVPQIDPVVFAAKSLADQLHERLGGSGMACTQLLVVAETEHGERLERLWRHGDAGRHGAFTAMSMVERVRWQLDGWVQRSQQLDADSQMATAGITLLRLVPIEVAADTGRQLGFWGGQSRADERAQRALARLTGLLGPEAVLVPLWRGGRSPAEAIALVSSVTVEAGSQVVGPRPLDGPWPGRLPSPSPATVMSDGPATKVDVLDASGRLVTVSGRGAMSAAPATMSLPGLGRSSVVAWAGPWLVDERWWDPHRHRRRARCQIVTERGTAHLVTIERGMWWLEGTYD